MEVAPEIAFSKVAKFNLSTHPIWEKVFHCLLVIF